MKLFKDFTLSDPILKSLDLLGYDYPTEVQQLAIDPLLNGIDVIIQSQTGSGKTASFAIPLCEKINWDSHLPQALVIAPTRELAVQIKEDIFHIGRFKRIKVVTLYGKSPMHLQVKQLKQRTHVVVGTPGRIIDHLSQGTLDLSEVAFLIVDEADELLKMGFKDQLEAIVQQLPLKRQNALFSATFPENVETLCKQFIVNPLKVSVEANSPVQQRIDQYKIAVDNEEKFDVFLQALSHVKPNKAIIFCNMQQTVEVLYEALMDHNYDVLRIHGGMEQKERMATMGQFKATSIPLLVATDVAARGIDVDFVEFVVNFDLPNHKDYYTHRIGRTGRIGNIGLALSLASPNDHRLLEAIEKYIGYNLNSIETIEEIALHETGPRLIQPSKSDKVGQEILQLHIKGGKKTKIRPVDIVGGLCSISSIEASDIGIINILDVSTYVEILNGKGRYVLEQLKLVPIKGRIREVSVSRSQYHTKY